MTVLFLAAGGPRAVHHHQTTSGIYQSSTMGKSSVLQVGASIQVNVSVNFARFISKYNIKAYKLCSICNKQCYSVCSRPSVPQRS